MSVLLQISDTHFGTEKWPVVEALAAFTAQQRSDVLARVTRPHGHDREAFGDELEPVHASPAPCPVSCA